MIQTVPALSHSRRTFSQQFRIGHRYLLGFTKQFAGREWSPTETVLTGIIGDNNSRGILQIKIKGTEQALIQQNILSCLGVFPRLYRYIDTSYPCRHQAPTPCPALQNGYSPHKWTHPDLPHAFQKKTDIEIGISKYMIIVIGIVQIQYHRLVTLYTHTIGIPEQSRINGNNLPFQNFSLPHRFFYDWLTGYLLLVALPGTRHQQRE